MRILETWRPNFDAEAKKLLLPPDPKKDLATKLPVLLDRYREIRDHGDKALFGERPREDYTWSMDGARAREVFDGLQPGYRSALRDARDSILDFYRPQRRSSWFQTGMAGEMLGQRIAPVKRAAFVLPEDWRFSPTSLMMYLAPAYIAGVKEIYLSLPRQADGSPPDPFSVALAWDWEVKELFDMPPQDALFAFTQGTESIPKVDVIVANGGLEEQRAALLVHNEVSCQVITESNEAMVLVDVGTSPRVLAADLFALSEDPALTRLTVVTPSMVLTTELEEELEALATRSPGAKEAFERIRSLGVVILTRSMDEALTLVERYPPKHLSVFVDRPLDVLESVHHAGVVYLGRNTPAGIEHFFASASNLIPASRAVARRAPLGVEAFLKASSLVHYTPQKVRQMHRTIAALAEGEDLPFHEDAFRIRMDESES